MVLNVKNQESTMASNVKAMWFGGLLWKNLWNIALGNVKTLVILVGQV